jgi:dTDP-4-dehydro-6-deoxy-alpha-D-glucopyranose 2,3-dehydratase
MFENINNDFLLSALTEKNPFIQTKDIAFWLQKKNEEIDVKIEKIPFLQLKDWYFTNNYVKLAHRSGKFFSIEGIRVNSNQGFKKTWDQPIINQPEIGYLGIITKKINGILYFLLQAKVEPGNINIVQLSPTLQATKSNFTQIHGGKAPLYLEYFVNNNKSIILLDQLQSEQGARFLKKRNRNIIIMVDEDIPILDNFIWLTLGQIKKLITHNNLINMDTRTVISGIPFNINNELQISHLFCNEFNHSILLSSISKNKALHSFDQLIAWITKLKCKYELEVSSIPLPEVDEWYISNETIARYDEKYFKVIGARITISNREVNSWCQPLIEPAHEGLIAFIIRKINGIVHFLVQAKLECGNFDIIELAPTVQCLTGNFRNPDYEISFLEVVLNAQAEQIVYDAFQSEEGGRFFHEQNRNMIVMVGEDFPEDLPESYTWITLYQLNTFIKFNNFLNIQARSLISAISFI